MKCENDPCRCTIADEASASPFCSDSCQRQSAAELECGCGHEACTRATTGGVAEDVGAEGDVELEDISGATGGV